MQTTSFNFIFSSSSFCNWITTIKGTVYNLDNTCRINRNWFKRLSRNKTACKTNTHFKSHRMKNKTKKKMVSFVLLSLDPYSIDLFAFHLAELGNYLVDSTSDCGYICVSGFFFFERLSVKVKKITWIISLSTVGGHQTIL